MKNFFLKMCFSYLLLIPLVTVSMATSILAQEASIETKWFSSEWGPQDERGAMNRLTPKTLLDAVKLIKKGKIYQLGRVYESDMPLFGKRHFSLTIPGSPTGGPFGSNNIVYNDEMFCGEIGQVGTQFDGLGHIGTRINDNDIYYNGFVGSEIITPYGLSKLGVENVGVFFTRGILLDIATYKGVERLDVGYIITVGDIEGTLKKQKLEIHEGDVILFYTGHGKLWKKDNETYNSGEPGPGITAIKWLVKKKIVMTGADNWGMEAVPGEDKDRPFEGHQWLMNRNGIYNLENLNLEELAADKVYEFAFIYAPVKLKGATGSPGNPIAVR